MLEGSARPRFEYGWTLVQAAGNNDIDIHCFYQISRDLNGFLNLESGKAGLVNL